MTTSLIPNGAALLLVPPVCQTVQAEGTLTGIMISRRGQISLLLDGAGLGVALESPAALRELALVLADVAAGWEDDQRAAADAATAELDALVNRIPLPGGTNA